MAYRQNRTIGDCVRAGVAYALIGLTTLGPVGCAGPEKRDEPRFKSRKIEAQLPNVPGEELPDLYTWGKPKERKSFLEGTWETYTTDDNRKAHPGYWIFGLVDRVLQPFVWAGKSAVSREFRPYVDGDLDLRGNSAVRAVGDVIFIEAAREGATGTGLFDRGSDRPAPQPAADPGTPPKRRGG